MRGVARLARLDSDAMEVCSKAPAVRNWPFGVLADAGQLNRLPCRIVEPGKVRNTLSNGERVRIYL